MKNFKASYIAEKRKSRVTKRKLREENIKLKGQVEMLERLPRPPVCTVERNTQEVNASLVVPFGEADMPVEYIKHSLAKELIEYAKPFIEYDVKDGEMGGKIYFAKMYVATGDKRKPYEE